MPNDPPKKSAPDDKRHSLAGNTRVQDEFLKRMVERQHAVAIGLTNGATVRGTIKDFDQYSLLLLPSPPGPVVLVYKHGVASVTVEVDAGTKQAG